MNLVIDIGNTFTKVAVADGQDVKYFQNTLEIEIDELDRIIKEFQPNNCIVSAVGKIPVNTLMWLKQNINVHVAGINTKIPIENKYSTPETLGFDRLALAVGAATLFPNRNVLVIDAGTAITYDFVTESGVYIGGAISPGLQMRFKALHNFTAKLPLIEKVEKTEIIGTTTKTCVSSGVVNGALFEIDGYIHQISSIYDDCVVVLTGGDSNFLANNLKNSIFVNQYLLIIGLNRILDFNVQNSI
ncbi:MAG: type pantothenate kinase [Tenuifilum sp.]|jgi:type III pantothenate kinase|uniref:type III pantothenate kinase n=1 Tax=Tenuifilum sp. TaxID=2760880 RepID=UPI0024ABBCD3|nr:type III pantothenate kinase [Tenuifilum sp.]MDI3525964.1 type pantothenate kinase [Tenuifilum sp.]